MKIAKRNILYNEMSRFNPVTLNVDPGEVFQVETELNTGDWLQCEYDVWSPEKVSMVNPSSGCIYIEGAKSGHMLAVKILDIKLLDLGYTGFAPGMTPFPDWIRKKEW
jgi:amidase